jgi:hypothetical protein
MEEISVNLHIHSSLSDGHGTYEEIAVAASKSGLDVIIMTDHNVFPRGLEGYYGPDNKQVLVLTGEEIHDQTRLPQKNHLLVFNTRQDFAKLADRTQVMVDQINKNGGMAFIAHPIDLELKAFSEPNISWTDWTIHGITGLELWNGMSEIKSVSKNALQAAFYAFFPDYLPHGPLQGTISIWDDLLSKGERIIAVGGADAHNMIVRAGPIRKQVFPYSYHFRTINNHLLIPEKLSGNLENDKHMIYDALRKGNLFIGYDLPCNTRGFHFTAQGQSETVTMGAEISAKGGVTFQIKTPMPAKVLLFHNGTVVERWKGSQICAYTTSKPGVYRVEVWIDFLGKRRGWIFSNPIYLR